MRLPYILLIAVLLAQVPMTVSLVSTVWATSFGDAKVKPRGPAAEQFRKGMALLEKGDNTGAQEAFEKCLEADHNHVGALAGLAEALVRQGRLKEARGKVQHALALQPKSGAVQQAWGRYLIAEKNFKKAEEAFHKAAQLEPNNASALTDLGNLYLQGLKHPDQAAKAFASAIRLAPDNAIAHFGLGTSYSLLGKPDDAFTELNTAIQLDPKNLLAYLAMGNLHVEQKAYEKALAAYNAALKIEPRFADAALAKSDILVLEGHLDEAKQSYLAVLDVDPNRAQAYNNLAWITVEQKGRLDEAVTWGKKAISLAPSVPQFKDTLGWVYRARGELDQAAELLKAASMMGSGDPSITYHLGVVLSEQGKKGEALAAFQKAMTLQPNGAFVKDAEQRIKTLSAAN